MDDIIALATDLGKRIADSERFRDLRKAEQAVKDNPETRELLQAVDEQHKRLAQKEQQQEPIEPAEKREVQRLNDAIEANNDLQALARTQADYLEMMKRVDEAIRGQLS